MARDQAIFVAKTTMNLSFSPSRSTPTGALGSRDVIEFALIPLVNVGSRPTIITVLIVLSAVGIPARVDSDEHQVAEWFNSSGRKRQSVGSK